MNDLKLIKDRLDFLEGRLDGTQQLVLGLANLCLAHGEDFQSEMLERLESTRAGLIGTSTPDRYFDGLDSVEEWIRSLKI